jgi:3-hydroxyisobutyrate dehydrogenase-like beta-hydroxyacid dehydrogenase
MAKIGFVGMGVMGAPMAAHLAKAGHEVTVWNRTAKKAEPLKESGAKVAANLKDLAAASDVIISCVGTTEDVVEVITQMVPHAKPGTLFIDQSTIQPEGAKRIAKQLQKSKLRFVDAPVTGGSMGAQKGTLTIFCGGDPKDVQEAIEVMKPYTKRAERVGEVGQGQMMKLTNQIAVAGALIGLCESLGFAKKAGLDIAQARELIAGGAGGSWAFENYGPMILKEDYRPGFSIKNQRKDLHYCQEAADGIEAVIPCADLVDELLEVLDDEGRGEDATAALYELYLELVPEEEGAEDEDGDDE